MNEAALITAWQGPLPPPTSVEAYEKVVKGAADRILTMAEEEAKNRHAVERDSVAAYQQLQMAKIRADMFKSLGGQLIAFSAVLLVIAASVYLAIGGHEKVAIAIIGVGVLAKLVESFVRRSEPATRVVSTRDAVERSTRLD